jgi:hypothetical protein
MPRPDELQTTWTARLSAEDGAAYDALVERGHFLQTRTAAALARAGRARQVRYVLVRAGGQLIGAAQLLRLGPLAWIERGPVTSAAALPVTLAAIERAARRRAVAWLQISPYLDDGATTYLRALGYQAEPGFAGLHRHTGRLAIGRSEDDLLAGPARAKLRTEIRRALRHGASTRTDDPVGPMLLARLAGRPASWGRAVAGLVATGTCAVVVGHDADGPVGAVLVSAHGGLATYLAGAAIADSRPYGKLLLPLVRAIAWARDRGVPTFDVGGLPAPGDTDPKRAAIARFKAMFAPDPVALIAPHRRWLWSFPG